MKTDHFSLKYILEQRISTPFQRKLLPKLLGLDYEVVYKKGKENAAVDALSRVHSSELLTMVLSNIHTNLLEKIKVSWMNDAAIQFNQLEDDPNVPSK